MTDTKKQEIPELNQPEHHELLNQPEHHELLKSGHAVSIGAPQDQINTTLGDISHHVSSLEEKNTSIDKWIRVLVGMLIIIIGGGIWWLNSSGWVYMGDLLYTISAEEPKTYEDTITSKIQENEKNVELMNRAMREQNILLCNGIIAPDQKNICKDSVQSSIYMVSGTLDDCKNISLEAVRMSCESAILQKTALSSMDKSLCARIQDPSQMQYCKEEIDSKILTNLIETKTATEENCSLLEIDAKTTCLTAIVRVDDSTLLQRALQEKNTDTCKLLSTDEIRQDCVDTIILRRATDTGKESDCAIIVDGEKRNACYVNMARYSDTEIFKNAIIDKSLTQCEDIQNGSLKLRCQDAVKLLLVRDSGNIDLCNSLSNTGMTASCRASVENR